MNEIHHDQAADAAQANLAADLKRRFQVDGKAGFF
jgi:hypothetical protein